MTVAGIRLGRFARALVRIRLAPRAAIRDALYRQAFGPVRWVEIVQAIRARGVTHIFECGPGKVLAGMVKRIDAEAASATIFDPASLADVKGMLA